MITIEGHLHSKKKALEEDISTYGMLYKAEPYRNKHLLHEIEEMKNSLASNAFDNIYGWEYFEEVCYLSPSQVDKLKSNETRKVIDFQYNEIFKHFNKLMYLTFEVDDLEETQKRFNSTRAKQPPIEEIIKILEFIPPDNETIEPLIKLLASIEGDYVDLIKHIEHKATYKLAKIPKLQSPYLNLDKLSELKKEYKTEIHLLRESMKSHNPKNYNKPTERLLDLLSFPLKI